MCLCFFVCLDAWHDGRMPKQLLVVHDDPSQLASLEQALVPEGERWQIDYWNAPLDALEVAHKKPYDVAIVALHMAKIGGVFFLTQLRHQSPGTARVLLVDDRSSGAHVAPGFPCAHRVLRQPWTALDLRDTLVQCAALSERISNRSLRQLLGQVGTLPAFPDLYWELTALLRREYYSVSEAATIVQKDPAMSVKLLQIANSAYFAASQKVTTVERALMLLGSNVFRLMVLTTYAFTTLTHDAPLARCFSFDVFQKHAWTIAKLVKKGLEDPQIAQDGFTAGLLHNIGSLVLATRLPAQYDALVQESQELGVPLWQAEQEKLGTTHAEIGAYLMSLWGLPNALAEAVLLHHAPVHDVTRIGFDILPTLQAVVHLAAPQMGGHYRDDKWSTPPPGKMVSGKVDLNGTSIERLVSEELAAMPQAQGTGARM